MRNAFAQELLTVAANDERLVMLSGDIGNRMFDSYKAQFPDRFFNCGIAEANMMSMAAGMAMCGLRPVVYTIVPFVTTRCLEQIRVDVCYHNTPVIIVGVGGGLSYASLGATHHACEDIALMRMLPQMTVVCPGDAHEVRLAFRQAMKHEGPVYLRLGKKGEPVVHQQEPDFAFGNAITLREGTKVALLSTGNLLPNVMAAAELLQQQGISARVVSMHTVKPIDTRLLDRVFNRCSLVVTIEEHSIQGGLGGAVAEWKSDRYPFEFESRLLRIGTPDAFYHEGGSQTYARQCLGFDAESLAKKIAMNL